MNNLKTFLNNYLALSKRELKSGNVAVARILIDEFNIISNKNLDLERQVRELQVLNKNLRFSLKEINDVFTDLHESNLSSMRKLSLITAAIADNDSEFDSKTIDKIKAVLNGNG